MGRISTGFHRLAVVVGGVTLVCAAGAAFLEWRIPPCEPAARYASTPNESNKHSVDEMLETIDDAVAGKLKPSNNLLSDEDVGLCERNFLPSIGLGAFGIFLFSAIKMLGWILAGFIERPQES